MSLRWDLNKVSREGADISVFPVLLIENIVCSYTSSRTYTRTYLLTTEHLPKLEAVITRRGVSKKRKFAYVNCVGVDAFFRFLNQAIS